jgi:Mg2+/Co2+ transporter CorB
MCHKKKFVKFLTFIIILIALLLAIAISVFGSESLTYAVYIGHFFDIMIPILAVGALLKYLLSHGSCCGCCCCHKHGEEGASSEKMEGGPKCGCEK